MALGQGGALARRMSLPLCSARRHLRSAVSSSSLQGCPTITAVPELCSDMLSLLSKLSSSPKSVCRCGSGPGETRASVPIRVEERSLPDKEGKGRCSVVSWPSDCWTLCVGETGEPDAAAGAFCDKEVLDSLSDAAAVGDKPDAKLQLCSGDVSATASSTAGVGRLQQNYCFFKRASELTATTVRRHKPVVAGTRR